MVLFLLSELRSVPRVVQFANNDKIIHFGLYAVLGGLLAWGQAHEPLPGRHTLPIGVGFLYGAVDELHQHFVPYRMPSWADWTADAIGVTVGYAVVFTLFVQVRRVLRRASGRS
ncbi:MAG: VanZ family protein [Gemmatimonadota bacterium]